MLFRIMIMIVIVVAVVMVRVRVSGPGRKWIRQMVPGRRAGGHFVVSHETIIELRTENSFLDIARHDGEGLAAVAERLAPFGARALWHSGCASPLIPRSPPAPC